MVAMQGPSVGAVTVPVPLQRADRELRVLEKNSGAPDDVTADSRPAPLSRHPRSGAARDGWRAASRETSRSTFTRTLQALRAECPEDLQPDIFDKDWPLTIWYRIAEFQLVSLKIIAEAPWATASRFAVPLSRPTPLEAP